MAQAANDNKWGELDDFVRAYEQAYARDSRANIAEFLPPSDHPLYAAVLRELVRVDLEYGWERGCPKALADYQRAFPQLAHDRAGLREIVYEEFRLRRLAGEDPSPDEYRHCYGDTVAEGLDRCRTRTRLRTLPRGRATAGSHYAGPAATSSGDLDQSKAS